MRSFAAQSDLLAKGEQDSHNEYQWRRRESNPRNVPGVGIVDDAPVP